MYHLVQARLGRLSRPVNQARRCSAETVSSQIPLGATSGDVVTQDAEKDFHSFRVVQETTRFLYLGFKRHPCLKNGLENSHEQGRREVTGKARVRPKETGFQARGVQDNHEERGVRARSANCDVQRVG